MLVFSSHQWPLFPGTGALEETGVGTGEGFTINSPLSAGHGDDDFIALYSHLLPRAAERFKPDLVLVSAGYDAHDFDPLGSMHISDEGFGILTEIVRRVAEVYADGRVAMMLEGGYDLDSLARSVHRTVEVLAGIERPAIDDQQTQSVDVGRIIAFHESRLS